MGIMAISIFGTKHVNLLIIPAYTNILTTQDYGTYDILCATVGLLIPVVILTVYNATLWFALDKGECKEIVLSYQIGSFCLVMLRMTVIGKENGTGESSVYD